MAKVGFYLVYTDEIERALRLLLTRRQRLALAQLTRDGMDRREALRRLLNDGIAARFGNLPLEKMPLPHIWDQPR